MAGRDAGVRVEGLRELRRDLKRLSPDVNRELGKEIKGIAEDVAADARRNAPRVTGTYARSIKAFQSRGGASVGSRLPQAGVLHWGGTIRPRGVPITFKPSPVIITAAKRMENEILERAGDAVDRAARKTGWR